MIRDRLLNTFLGLQFSGQSDTSFASAVVAGPTNSVVIDKQGMYWMAGKVFFPQVTVIYSASILTDGPSGKTAERVSRN